MTGAAAKATERRDEAMPYKKNSDTYIVDDNGKKVGVIVDFKKYKKMLEELEELDDIKAYDAAKASGDEAIPFEQAIEEMEKSGR